jgi:hypothetical protein
MTVYLEMRVSMLLNFISDINISGVTPWAMSIFSIESALSLPDRATV